jgi:hypothetical protein
VFDNMTPAQFAKYLAEAQAEAAKINSGKKTVGRSEGQNLDDYIAQIQRMTKNLTDSNKNLSVWKTLTGKANDEFTNVRDNLEELDKAIENATTVKEADTLRAQRQAYRDAAVQKLNHDSMVKFGKSIGDVSSKALTGVGTFIKGLTGGESGIQVASGLMEAAVDVGSGAASAFGGALQAGGAAMSTFSGKTKIAGFALEGAGMALSYFSESAGKLAKFGIQVLSKEVEKLSKAFNDSTAAGAFFTNGLTGLRNSALDAGLTVDQFANVLKQHGADLAAAGLGVTEGSRRVGGALRAGGDTMRKQLLNLGYSFEEQAGLVAETMRDMRQSGGPLRSSNAVVAAETSKYAENLRIISAITGEDAKKKSEAVRQQMNQLSFQQKIASLGETERIRIGNAMKNMSDLERKNFMDMVNFGTIINQEGAAAAALSPGLTNAVNGYYSAFQSGTLDEIEARKISMANTEQQKQDLLNNTAIGLAGAANVGGLVGQLAETMGKELEYRNKWTADAIAAAEVNVKGQKETADALTDSLTGAEVAAQDLKIALQKELTPAIAQFAKVSREMLGEVQSMLNKLGIGNGSSGSGGNSSTVGGDVGKIGFGAMAGGAALEALAGLSAMTGVGLAATPFLASAGGALLSGGSMTSLVGGLMDSVGFAEGGISTGSESGHKETLHGTEAVVPLPNGKSIPVTFDGSIRELTDKIEQLLDVHKDTRDLTQKLLNASS